MTAPPLVVLDTNVVLSALVFPHGRLTVLRRAWQDSRCCPLVSAAAAEELIRALSSPKFKLTPDERQELLADYLPFCNAIQVPADAPRILACRDPFDLPFLQLAVVGRADYLVSGDKDLLSLASEFQRPIITGDTFLSLLNM
ncbi:MAG: putative toxin-antitoxin system toxin component, PIN family [Alphaproteobacteria bacterium]|nr:putative toxin-antitoxin system toxin component, PIN family [Alphaproteobacteria bacterium]